MLLRKVLFVAIAVAPLVLSPTTVEAQNRGLDRATVASADGQERAEAHGKRANKRHGGLPAGVAKRFEGQALPPGIRRTRRAPAPVPEVEPEAPQPDVEPDVEPEVEPDVEPTGCVIVELPGLPPYEDCSGRS